MKIGRIQNRFDYLALVFVPISVLKAGVFRTEFLQIHLGILYSCPYFLIQGDVIKIFSMSVCDTSIEDLYEVIIHYL